MHIHSVSTETVTVEQQLFVLMCAIREAITTQYRVLEIEVENGNYVIITLSRREWQRLKTETINANDFDGREGRE